MVIPTPSGACCWAGCIPSVTVCRPTPPSLDVPLEPLDPLEPLEPLDPLEPPSLDASPPSPASTDKQSSSSRNGIDPKVKSPTSGSPEGLNETSSQLSSADA